MSAPIRRADFSESNAGSRVFYVVTRRLAMREWKELDGQCACQFTRYKGFGTSCLETLRRAAHEHGVKIVDHYDHMNRAVAPPGPERFMGVTTPPAVRKDWTESEAEWWRRGVAAAVSQLRKDHE